MRSSFVCSFAFKRGKILVLTMMPAFQGILFSLLLAALLPSFCSSSSSCESAAHFVKPGSSSVIGYRGGTDDKESSTITGTWTALNSWFQSTGDYVYQKTVKPALDVVLLPVVQKGPIEQYEIFGVWRICLDDGDEIVFLEIRPHEIAFKSKDNTLSYKFTEASWPYSARIEFKYKKKTYTASLRRKIPRTIKLKGEIYQEGLWWKRSIGTFVGRKMAYRELKGEEAKIWNDADDDDCTATTTASSISSDDSQKKPSIISVKLKQD